MGRRGSADSLGGGLVGEMLPPLSWGHGAAWLPCAGDTKAGVQPAFPESSLGISLKTIRSLQYLQIYLPIKSAQVYQ